MKRTLVTLLGRAQNREGKTGYEKATYRFPDGATYRSAYSGQALASHLDPDNIVILGTAGSQWSALVEDLAGEGHEDEEARIELISSEESERVDQSSLDRIAPLMGRAMNAAVLPVLISSGVDESEQYAILEAINKTVFYDGELHFDLTQAFGTLAWWAFSPRSCWSVSAPWRCAGSGTANST